MTKENYIQYLQSPETLSKESVLEFTKLTTKYPFCQSLQMLLMLNLLQINSNDFEKQLSVTAACIPNRKILKELINSFSIAAKKRENAQTNPKEIATETIIDKFIKENPKINTPLPNKEFSTDIEKDSLSENENIVSETLAMVYEKQGYYKKAIQIYEKLSLENPEKSSSFAARIKKLKNT